MRNLLGLLAASGGNGGSVGLLFTVGYIVVFIFIIYSLNTDIKISIFFSFNFSAFPTVPPNLLQT